jgi:hypothetical protein
MHPRKASWSKEGLSLGKELPSFHERGWEQNRDLLHEKDDFSLLYI